MVTKIGSDTVTGYSNGNAFVSFVFFFFTQKYVEVAPGPGLARARERRPTN